MDSNSKSKGNDLVCVQAVADDLASIAARIRAAMGRSIECIVAIGQELSFVKRKLPHGRFNSWIAEEFHFSERTAQNYMNAAAAFAHRTAIVAYLPATLVYDLAAKSTPSAVREDIVSLLESSVSVAPDEIATRLQDARQAALLKRKAALLQREEERAAAGLQGLSAEERRKQERNERKRSRSKAAREADEHRRLQERAEAARISEENAGRAFELLRSRLSDDELVAFRSLHGACLYEFRKALESWNPELSAPASIEPPPVAL